MYRDCTASVIDADMNKEHNTEIVQNIFFSIGAPTCFPVIGRGELLSQFAADRQKSQVLPLPMYDNLGYLLRVRRHFFIVAYMSRNFLSYFGSLLL